MKYSNRETSGYFIITLLFPFAGLIISLANWRKVWAKNVFWLACIYMGAIQIFQPEGTILGTGADGGRYALELVYMHNNVHSFSAVASTFFDGHTNDIFQPTLTYIVSRFTDNGHVLFFFLAIIYGFFYSRNIWYILEKLPKNLPSGFWVLIAYFFLVCPIWAMNGFRMWTALHVFVYGALPFVLDGKKDKLVWSFLSILVHHSFILPIVLLGAYYLLSKPLRTKTWTLTFIFIFYLISLTIKKLNLTFVSDILSAYLPDYYDMRIDGYLTEDNMEARQEDRATQSAYIGILSNFKFWSTQFLVVISYLIVIREKNRNKSLLSLFSFALLMYGFAIIASLAPSGGRYVLIALMFLVPVFLFVFSQYPVKTSVRWLFNLALFGIGIALLFDIRQGMDYYGYTLILGNFITMLFLESNVPLITFIKQLI